MNYKIINNDIIYHDGVYKTVNDIEYLGFNIPKGNTHNGVTGFFTSNNMIMPSMLHDYLLLTQEDRGFADYMFLEAMKKENINIIKRTIFYGVVCITTDIKRWTNGD